MKKYEDSNFPKILYKYRSWPNNNTEDILINNRLYFSSLEDFNDPFEGAIPIDFTGRSEELLSRYVNGKKKEGNDLSAEQIEIIEKKISMRTEDELKKFADIELEALKKTFGVCSLSSNKNSILMWSHYAQNHTGICIGIQGLESSAVKKVYYTKKYPELKYIKNMPEEIIDKQIYTKSFEWKYEHEYRLVVQDCVRKTLSINPSMIKCVICGCKMPVLAIDHLKNILINRAFPVTLYQAKKNKNDFGLNIEKNIIGVYGGGENTGHNPIL